MTTFAVTGATGSFGRLALSALAASVPTSDIVAIVRNADRAADLIAAGYDVRVAAYDNPTALVSALAGVDRLLLVSGSEVGQRVAQHANVITAAAATEVSRIVYTSAPHADNTTLILAPEHTATERLLADSGLSYVAVRNNWYNENYINDVETVRSTGVLTAAAGDGRVASASRADLAEGAVAVLLADEVTSSVLEFTGTEAWDFTEFAAVLSELLGSPVRYNAVSVEERVAGLLAAGADEGTAGFVSALENNIAEGTLGDVSPVLTELLGRPTTRLIDTLRNATSA